MNPMIQDIPLGSRVEFLPDSGLYRVFDGNTERLFVHHRLAMKPPALQRITPSCNATIRKMDLAWQSPKGAFRNARNARHRGRMGAPGREIARQNASQGGFQGWRPGNDRRRKKARGCLFPGPLA
jgi:hypothetical protein